MSGENIIEEISDGPLQAVALGAGAYAAIYALATALSTLGVPAVRLNVLGPLALVGAGWVLVARLGVDPDDPREAAVVGLALAVGFGVPLLVVAWELATPVGRALATPLVLSSDVGAAVLWPLALGGAGALYADLDANYDLSATAREAVASAPQWSLPAGAAAYLLAYGVAWALRSVLGVGEGLGLLGPVALVVAGFVVADRNGLRWRGAESAVGAVAVGLALVPGFAVLLVGATRVAGTPVATALATPPVSSGLVAAAVAWPVAAGAAGALLAVLHDEHDLRATAANALLAAPAWSLLGGVAAYAVAYAVALVLANGLGVSAGLSFLGPAALVVAGWVVADRNGHRWRTPASVLPAVAVGLVLTAGFAGAWVAAGTLLAGVLPASVVDPAVTAALLDPFVLSSPLQAALAWPAVLGTAGAALFALDAAYGFEDTGTDAVFDAPAWSLLAGAAAYAVAYAVAFVLADVLGVSSGLNLLAPAALVLAGWVVADRNGHRWHGAGTVIAAVTVGLVTLVGFLAATVVGTRLATPVATALGRPLVLSSDLAAAVAWPVVFGGAGAALYAYHREYGLYATTKEAVGTAPGWSLPAGAAAYLLALLVATLLASVLGVTAGISLLAPAALVLAGWVVADRNRLRFAGAGSVVASAAVGLALVPGFAALAVATPRLLDRVALPLVGSAVPAALLDPFVLSSPLQAALAWPVAFGAAGAAGRVLDDEYDYANRETTVAFARRAPWPGAVLGAVTFLAGYHALVVAATSVFGPFGALGFLPLDLGIPPGEKVGGWLYYNLHGVAIHAPTGVDVSFGITTETVGVGDLSVEVPDGFDASADVIEGRVYLFGRGPASILRVVPGVPLAAAGVVAAAVGSRLGERSVRASVADGAALAVGFAPLFLSRAARLDYDGAIVFEGGEVGLDLFGINDVGLLSFSVFVVRDGWFYAGAVALPLVFGALGALAWCWRTGRL